MRQWIINVLLAVSRLLNALIGGAANETVSGRAYRLRDTSRSWARAYKLINLLFFLQTDHCRIAYDYDQK